MNERRTRLKEQFQAAEAAVDASNAVLRKRSAERLESLLKLSARERLSSFADASLTPFDREQLERSLEAQLPRQHVLRVDAPVAKSLWGKRFVRRHRRGLIATVLTIVPMALFGVKALLMTPPHPIPIQVNRPLAINWTLPDGSLSHENLPAGSLYFLYAKGDLSWFRRWFPSAGYGATGPIPEELLTRGIISRRPQALSAVPPRSVTN